MQYLWRFQLRLGYENLQKMEGRSYESREVLTVLPDHHALHPSHIMNIILIQPSYRNRTPQKVHTCGTKATKTGEALARGI